MSDLNRDPSRNNQGQNSQIWILIVSYALKWAFHLLGEASPCFWMCLRLSARAFHQDRSWAAVARGVCPLATWSSSELIEFREVHFTVSKKFSNGWTLNPPQVTVGIFLSSFLLWRFWCSWCRLRRPIKKSSWVLFYCVWQCLLLLSLRGGPVKSLLVCCSPPYLIPLFFVINI